MNRKPSILVIFLSVFIDLIGFGIVLPLLPGYAEDNFRPDFSAKGLVIGGIIASFSAMQFFFAPVWGRLSDRIGRRPVMLVSNLGAAGSYAIFAIACGMDGTTGLVWILLSRIFAGICGANLSVASAYIADISPPEKRSARMGLIGMAFGLGFIFGPAIGAFAIEIFHSKSAPGWVAACFCAGNFILGWFILGESRKPNSEHVAARPKINQWSHTLAQPKLGLLISVFFLATFCFTQFGSHVSVAGQTPICVWRIKSQPSHSADLAFIHSGQRHCACARRHRPAGKKIRRAEINFYQPDRFCRWSGRIAVCERAAGNFNRPRTARHRLGGLNRPGRFRHDIAEIVAAQIMGANLGVAQSFGSLARILGPVFASTLFFVDVRLPYLICGGVTLLTGLFAWKYLCNGSRLRLRLKRKSDLAGSRIKKMGGELFAIRRLFIQAGYLL